MSNRVVSPLLALLFVASSAAAQSDSVVIDERQWMLGSNGEDLPWAEAERHCQTLALDGHDDWRLPTFSELEALHDPGADGGILAPIELDTCCIWSSSSLADRSAESSSETAGQPSQYYWGFLFEAGTSYYSFQGFPDGRALCVRDTP